MASHSRENSYNSCQRVPKDINCLNPDCKNLQKSYHDNSSDNSSFCCKRNNKSFSTTSEAFDLGCSGVKPLAKFYDSIPDYCDIYHLPKAEFDITLDALRSTCHKLRCTEKDVHLDVDVNLPIKLKIKHEKAKEQIITISPSESASEFCFIDDIRTSSLSSSLPLQQSKDKKSKKTSKKKMRKLKVQDQGCLAIEPPCISTPCNLENQDYLFDKNRFKSFKEDCEREVEAFRQSLREFEKELKRPISSACPLKNFPLAIKMNGETPTDHEQKRTSKKDRKSTLNLSESLKKSLSLNDIHEAPCDNFSAEENRNDLTAVETSKASFFLTSKNDISKRDQQEQSTKSYEPPCQFNQTYRTAKKKKRSKSEENFKIPYTPFSHSDYRLVGLQASPVHPVARPNLAATLRAEVCKQKLREQKTKCIFYDGTKHFDWEVRKTPAWKSLSMQETHDQALMLRLAARKAEQALQQRQYKMNLELMRQRVKSAPLLLEGETHFGINAGKLTHTCHEVGSQQNCHSHRSSRQRMRKKNSYSSLTLCPRHKTELCMSQEIFKCTDAESRLSNKMHTIQKIYANSSKLLCPAHSQKSDTSSVNKHKSRRKIKEQKLQHQHIESGDELSSVDRAYL